MHPSQPAPDRFFYFWLALLLLPWEVREAGPGENAELNRCRHALEQVIILQPEHFILSLSQCFSVLIKKKKIIKSRTSTTLFIFLWLRWKHSWWLLFHKIPHIQPGRRALKSHRVNLASRHQPVRIPPPRPLLHVSVWRTLCLIYNKIWQRGPFLQRYRRVYLSFRK